MTANNRSKSDPMNIRCWLKLAAIGFLAFAGLSSVVLYKMALNLQFHMEAVLQASRLQAANAELARNVPLAWLDVETGDHNLAVPALAELRRATTVARTIADELATRHEQHVLADQIDARGHWLKLRSSLAALIEAAEPIVSRSRVIRPAAGPATTMDRTAFESFNARLKSSISQARFASAQSESGMLWAMNTMHGAVLVIIGIMIAYGMFLISFIDHKIRVRARDVSLRILQYTNGPFSPPTRVPLRDEFGVIEAQIDECAQKVHGEQMRVASAHQETLQQLEERTSELSKLNEALKVSGRALARFLTDVSHDLRTPLAIMVGESEVSLRSQSTSVEEYKETLSRMLEQTRYLGSLVDQLLYTARSRVSTVPLEPDYVDILELVQVACRDMKTLADKSDIAIEIEGGIESCIVLGDQIRLREMMLTILDNAIEYSRPGGTISVVVTEQAPFLRITISDTGIGIPANEMPMIFRRFYRAQNAPDANAQGTGIGLAVAKGIVESHSGTIEIDSAEDQGTMVTLCLPLVDQSRLDTKVAPLKQSSKEDAPNRLLI